MRELPRGLFRLGVCALLASGLGGAPAPAALAEDGGKAWRVLRPPAELLLRFEDRGESAPCPPFGSTPAAATVECWSAHVDRSLAQEAPALSRQPELACLPAWEVSEPGEGGCPEEAARCIRPRAGMFSSVPRDLPIAPNIRAALETSQDLGREYTTFQMLRNGQALNPHRPRIAGLALAQGMLVLRHAHALVAATRDLEADGCATDHMQPYALVAERATQEVGATDLRRILETYPPPGREWARRFHRVQLEVLGRSDGPRASAGGWREDCQRALALGPRVGSLDADVNVWCGYAYERLRMRDEAFEHWVLARRSANHPEASSYADEHLKRPRETGIETAARDGRGVSADGGGQ